jgi:flagellar basal-body rod modification protein FlgD
MSSTLSGVSSYGSATEATAAASMPTDNLDRNSFLTLLTVQLANQDPLEPQENAAFVAQLAQFSSLEQLSNANTSLESLYVAIASMNNASMTQLLGNEFTAAGDTFHYTGSGDESLNYDADQSISNATLTVTDENGVVVYSEALGSLPEGEGSVSWDGSTIKGGTAEEGDYTFTITGSDADGDSVQVTTLVKGVVDGMDYTSGQPTPSIEGVEISLAEIRWVGEPAAEGT